MRGPFLFCVILIISSQVLSQVLLVGSQEQVQVLVLEVPL